MTEKTIKPIGIIHTDFKEKFGIPRQSGRVNSAIGKIALLPPYNDKSAIKELTEFSHIWLIFEFSKCVYNDFSPTVRPPRLGGNKRVGVFATRSPFRPNGLGLSVVKLEKITDNGELIVSGVDLLDKTPIYDIKPYLPYADIKLDAAGGFAEENKNHRLVLSDGKEFLSVMPEDKRQTVIDCLCEDPRPSYQSDPGRIYIMQFDVYDIHFKIDENNISILSVDKL